MFLSQCIHESAGFSVKEEWMRATDPPYYGRGYIQLTHDYNYRAAS
jgi:hypothetical protein